MSNDRTAAPGVGLPRGRELDLPRLSHEDDDVLRGESGASDDAAPAGAEGEGRAPEAPGVLARSVNLRFPDLTNVPAGERAEKLQDHILATAVMRGELAALRMQAHVALRQAKREWDKLMVEVSGKSKAELDRRRHASRPDLADSIADARWTIERATEEMARHGGTEYESASRAYTMLSGS